MYACMYDLAQRAEEKEREKTRKTFTTDGEMWKKSNDNGKNVCLWREKRNDFFLATGFFRWKKLGAKKTQRDNAHTTRLLKKTLSLNQIETSYHLHHINQ